MTLHNTLLPTYYVASITWETLDEADGQFSLGSLGDLAKVNIIAGIA